MEDLNIKSLRFPVATNSKLESISQKLGRNKRTLFIQMVEYFYKSKKDPQDINDELLKNTLLKSHKEYIGFIKTQESELLIPIKKEVGRMIEFQKKVLESFDQRVVAQNESLLKNQRAQSLKFSQYDEVMRTVLSRLDTKEKLKREFLFILDSYIKARESFGMMTPAREKDELIKRTKTLTNNL